jgi:hypothetical protein
MPEKRRTGLLIVRAWMEEGSSAPLRAHVSTTADVSTGIERSSVHTEALDVDSEVRAWLGEILAGI